MKGVDFLDVRTDTQITVLCMDDLCCNVAKIGVAPSCSSGFTFFDVFGREELLVSQVQ